MIEFKQSKQLSELLAKRAELEKKQREKKAHIDALYDSQQSLLDKKRHDLEQAVNDYAAAPSDELADKIDELEKEIAILQAKVAGAQNRKNIVFQSDMSELAELNRKIDAQARAEYLAHFARVKADLYAKIGNIKSEYLEALKTLHDAKVAANQGYSKMTGNNAIVDIHEPDFFYEFSGYRPLGISENEVKKALRTGEIEDKRDYPKS